MSDLAGRALGYATPADLLAAMVNVNSVNPLLGGPPDGQRRLAGLLEQAARRAGLEVRRLPAGEQGDNLLVSVEKHPGGPWIVLESHLDTVEVSGMDDPFGARIEGGRLHGRGACDTKGSGAAMLWAIADHAVEPAPANAALLFVVGEEVGKQGARAFADRQLAQLGFRPEGIVVGEPTGLRLVTATGGVVRWPIVTYGLAAHSSDPTRGRSAISAMVKVIAAIESRYVPAISAAHPLTGPARCSINQITGGTAINIVPDRCEIRVDRRLVPGEDPNAVLPEVEALLADLRATHPDLAVEQLPPFTVDPPLDPGSNAAFAARVGAALAAVGLSAAPVGVTFGTDASTYAAAGVPAVVLGPGDIAQAHTTTEWLSLAQLARAVEIYAAVLRR